MYPIRCGRRSRQRSHRRSGALLSRKAFKNFKRRLDYSEYGGAPLLGVRGACIIGHGSSNEVAILNAIRVASQFAQADTSGHIEAALRGL